MTGGGRATWCSLKVAMETLWFTFWGLMLGQYRVVVWRVHHITQRPVQLY